MFDLSKLTPEEVEEAIRLGMTLAADISSLSVIDEFDNFEEKRDRLREIAVKAGLPARGY